MFITALGVLSLLFVCQPGYGKIIRFIKYECRMNLTKLARHTFWALMSLGVTALIIICIGFFYLEIQLPSVEVLNRIQLQVPLKIYTGDGELIGEFGEIRRSPVTLNEVPKQLINAVLATEDQRYYEHPGVDIFGIFRAVRELAVTGKPSQGASTITMQVARNFFLTRKKTFGRKFNEMLLALKIDHDLSKEKILELYLNKIYLGQRAYGVASAAQVYYGKTLDQLTLPEMAMIAGLPQAPSRNNPINNPAAAMDRRNHVLQRMYEQGYIDKVSYEKAINAPNTASYHGQRINIYAPYVAEMVRAAMYAQYGEAAYTSGFKVYTTLDSHMQNYADQALRDGLIAYDMRHGYRGPEKNLGSSPNIPAWQDELGQMPIFNYLRPAAVIKVDDNSNSANALLANGQIVQIPWAGLSWARRYINNQYVGASPKEASDVVKVGDVIRIQLLTNGQWQMAEMPKVEGAIVVLDPNTGKVLALSGGFSFQESHFNRVIQAIRQPGSNFKPFIYSAALNKGFTLASIINDAPIVENDNGGIWRPVNDELNFYGPTRLRVGLIESRNLVTIRLLRSIGIRYALDYISRFGFDPAKLPHSLSLALGSGGVTPLQIVSGYAVFANGGYRITPYLINQVENPNNQIVYQAHLPVVCDNNCSNSAPRVITAQNAYLITSALQDVIRKGTGEGALVLKRNDVAGKTGTTNEMMDAWFSGYNSDIVTSVWIGFDNPESLYEHGAQAAIPIWVDFMQQALQGKPEHTMAQPPGIVTVKVDPATGQPAGPQDANGIFEMFTQDTVPSRHAQSDNPADTTSNAADTSGDNNDNSAVESLF